MPRILGLTMRELISQYLPTLMPWKHWWGNQHSYLVQYIKFTRETKTSWILQRLIHHQELPKSNKNADWNRWCYKCIHDSTANKSHHSLHPNYTCHDYKGCDSTSMGVTGGKAAKDWSVRNHRPKRILVLWDHCILSRAPTSEHPAENLQVFRSYWKSFPQMAWGPWMLTAIKTYNSLW